MVRASVIYFLMVLLSGISYKMESENEPQQEGKGKYTYDWENGNLKKVSFLENQDYPDELYTIAEYSSIINPTNVNVDINWFIYKDKMYCTLDGNYEFLNILGLNERRNATLVKRSVDNYGNEWNYSYKVRENGLVDQVTISSKDETIHYNFNYEKRW